MKISSDCTLKKSASMLDDKCLLKSSSNYALIVCNEELDEVFWEQMKIILMKGENITFIVCLLAFIHC